jgi:thiol-disulfide isomerase/thioredoxin
MVIKKPAYMDTTRILLALAIMAAILLATGCLGGTPEAGGNATTKTNVTMVMYEGIGCPHCANMITSLTDIAKTYNFSLTLKEVKYDPENNREMLSMYDAFGYDASMGGIPTTIVNGRLMVVGEVSRGSIIRLIELCETRGCPAGAFTSTEMEELIRNIDQNASFEYGTWASLNWTGNASVSSTTASNGISLMVLIPAAVADSINPCTMAVMAMLLAITLEKKGKKNVLVSGLVFTAVIFVCYFMMGIGVLKVVGDISIQKYFFYLMVAITAIITVLEIKSYFFYRPGMEAIELPMSLRPHLQNVMAMATSLPMVAVVAVLCSLFLLPCSSGPYLMILSMMAMTNIWTMEFFTAIGYLLFYNFIFVLPLAAIAVIVAFGIKDPGQILAMRDKYVKQMHLFAGLVMLLITIMLLAFIFGSSLFR